jgi:hypothetical protein
VAKNDAKPPDSQPMVAGEFVAQRLDVTLLPPSRGIARFSARRCSSPIWV